MTVELSEEAAMAVIEVLDLGKFTGGLPYGATQLLDAIATTHPHLVTRYGGSLWSRFHRGVARSLGAGDEPDPLSVMMGGDPAVINRTIAHLLLTGRGHVNSVSEEARLDRWREMRITLTLRERHQIDMPSFRAALKGNDL